MSAAGSSPDRPGTVQTSTPAPAPRSQSLGPLPSLDKASWIWSDAKDDICQVRTVFKLDEAPATAGVLITADNGYELYVNGTQVGYDIGSGSEVWNSVERYDIASRLARGKNVIGIRATDLGGIRGLVAAARIDVKGRPPLEIVTDAAWRAAAEGDPVNYSHPEFIEGPEWTKATVLGPLGMAPWGKLAYVGSVGGRRPRTLHGSLALSKPDADFRWPEELLFVGDDCSVYVPLRGDAWGVCFRIGDWSRAFTEFDIPCPVKIGRKLYALKPGPGAKPRLLVDAGKGAIGSPSVSFDGKWIYAAMAIGGDSFFHIYRIPAQGGAPQRLTGGPYHDIDPSELPDGRIVFTSTRIGSFEEYHNPPSRALFVMNSNGSQVRPITFTLIFDNEPKVMADGRIVFIRTDNFFDRGKVETQLHVMRPDGTDGHTEFGADVGPNYGVRLRALGYGSPAPMPDGRVACISTRGNFIASPGSAESAHQPLPGGLGDLAPLPDGRLLATVLRPSGKRQNSDVIAVIDPRDNQMVSIYQSPSGSVHSPVFLGPRARPSVIPDQVDPKLTGTPAATGFLNCQNVRFTRKLKADWQQVRAIRVLGAQALTTRSSHSHIVHAGHETVELGTVPIAPDGSFSIEVPADIPITLQAVDAEGRSELNEMSWIYVRPGERRSCLGCHHPRGATPLADTRFSQSLRARPLKVLGQGQAHRSRGNNSGVTGMMDLQFERFRETASLNRYATSADAMATGQQEAALQISHLRGRDAGRNISAAQRLAIFRDRTAAPALAERLGDDNREVRVAAAVALAACGTRESVPALLDALGDRDPVVAQAAAVALENLTAHAEPFEPFVPLAQRKPQIDAWRAWFKEDSWEAIERSLIKRIGAGDRVTQRRAIVALGHVGGDAARAAIRQFVAAEKDKNPYPAFVNDNRTDTFTYPADSPLNPRTLQEAARAIGYLNDADAVPLLREILAKNIEPKSANLYLAEAAVEALGRIGTPEAEAILIDAFGKLKDYWHYVGWYSDHPALYACHSSPVHARIIMALDWIGSTRAGPIAPHLIRSVPTDPDRALFPQNDDYETLVGRVLRRSGRGDALVETCLALLGDRLAPSQRRGEEDLNQAVSTTFACWAGKPAPDNRAAQILSSVCRDRRYESRIRAAYERYRAMPGDPISRPLGNPDWIPQRHWVLFFLGRTLGNLGAADSVETLLASLKAELNEARHGRPDPSEPNIHFLQLEYTPCWRATAAWALGKIGQRRTVPALLSVVGDLNNATDVRHAAAEALAAIADPSALDAMSRLAQEYPEHSIRKALLRGCDGMSGRSVAASTPR
jgi:HEAT repeat protein